MKKIPYTHQQLLTLGKLSQPDLQVIRQSRQNYTRLGFAYQLAFVRLINRFPEQRPFEILEELLTYVSVQMDLPSSLIDTYLKRQPTLSAHRKRIQSYLQLRRLGNEELFLFKQFLLDEASRLEQTGALLTRAERYLRAQGIVQPAEDTLRRVIIAQRQQARQHIYERIAESLSPDRIDKLDALLRVDEDRISPFQRLKESPRYPSPTAMLQLIEKADRIVETGALDIDLGWLNNNYQRSLTRYAKRCSAAKLRDLKAARRYAVLVCFLWQTYRDHLDYMVDMHDKLMTRVYKRAQDDIDEQARQQRRMIRVSLSTLRSLGQIILNEDIDDRELRRKLFSRISKESLATQMASVETWLSGRYSHVFKMVTQRFTYLRRFTPALLRSLEFHPEAGTPSTVVEAVQLLHVLNEAHKRKLPEDAPLDFIPRKLRSLVATEGEISKRAWECALLTAVRDEIRAGNIYVLQSKRFGRFDDFFISSSRWHAARDDFFLRSGMPVAPKDVPAYLTGRLNLAYDRFLESLPKNTFASVNDAGWQLSTDPAEKLTPGAERKLEKLHLWLEQNMRVIKLPELLIEVDNELQFTHHFMTSAQQGREAEQVCLILAAVMAHGCNIGPHTMAQMTTGVTYNQIKHVTDWQLSEEAQRQALAQVVNAISQLDVTQAWGAGKTSSSDGQRFRLQRKVLQRTYSHKFRDYAIEFYSFVADNYAPFYSMPIECTDRDAAYVLDGLLYNESDLALEEHYVDTHGYTEINFAAFAMLGRRFAPRIRGLQKQRIYRIDRDKDYGPLSTLVGRRDRLIHLDWICEQWDRMGQFYVSLEQGHTTASTALKRLASFSGKNQFYRANRELGRVFKTEHVLRFMSDPLLRKSNRRGLLKHEEMHALARQVSYGKQGTITSRDLEEQRNTSNCLTLIIASVIYWQAKEINRVILECDPEGARVDLTLLEHVSPIGWNNVLLYGEYVLNRQLVQP